MASYESQTTTTTSSTSTGIGLHFDYLKTIPGILKIVELVLSLITFICSCVGYWGSGQDVAQFVSITAFLSTLLYLVLHILNLISRFPGPALLIEFIFYCVWTVFYLIAAIVCAVDAKYAAAIGAAAFFSFAATAVYAVDGFFQYRAWRTGETEMSTATHSTHTTTTTATTTTMEKEQY